MNPEWTVTKWVADNILYFFSAVFGAIATAFMWLINDNNRNVRMEDELKVNAAAIKATDAQVSKISETLNLAQVGTSAKFDVLGKEMSRNKEQASEKFATRDDLATATKHLQDLLGHVTAGQANIALEVRRINDKIDETTKETNHRYDKLYDAVINVKRSL